MLKAEWPIQCRYSLWLLPLYMSYLSKENTSFRLSIVGNWQRDRLKFVGQIIQRSWKLHHLIVRNQQLGFTAQRNLGVMYTQMLNILFLFRFRNSAQLEPRQMHL